MSDLLRKKQMSQRYGIPVPTLNDWRHRGVGPRSFLLGGIVVYKVEDVEKWIAQQYEKSGGDAA